MPPRKAQPKTKPTEEPEAEPALAEDPAPEIPPAAPDPPPAAVAPARATPMSEEELKRHMQNLLASGPAAPPPPVTDRTSSVVYLDESMNSFVLDLARRLGWTKQDVIQGCIAFVRQDTQTRGLMYTEVALGRAYQPKR